MTAKTATKTAKATKATDNHLMGNMTTKVATIVPLCAPRTTRVALPASSADTSPITLHLTPEQRYKVAQVAFLANMSLEAYIRARVLFVTQ